MALGDSIWSVIAGGGQQKANASALARTVVQLGVCALGTPNVLLQPGDQNALLSLAGPGPLTEAGALRLRAGQICYLMPINPSVAGGVSSSVTVAGSQNGTMSVSLAPHQQITVKCILGGAVGTASFQFAVGSGAYGATIASVGPAPWIYMVPGTFCTISFPTATYVANTTATIGVNGVVTLGTGWAGTITQTSSPLDYYEFYASIATAGGFGVGQLAISLDNGPAPNGGGSTLPPTLLPANGTIVVPNTGLVLQIGQHVIVVTITTAGALGTAIFSYTIDGGAAVTGNATTPNSGANFVFTFPQTGVTFTFAPGTYVLSSTYTDSALGVITIGGGGINTVTQSWAGFLATDTYSFLASPPSYATTDLSAALTALQAIRGAQFTAVHVVGMPSSAANAVSAQATIDAAIANALSVNALDWQALCECPSKSAGNGLGDIVMSGSSAIRDTADTDAVIIAARGADTNRTAVHVGSYRAPSALQNNRKPLRPLGWFAAARYCDTDPAQELAAISPFGPLAIYVPPGSTGIGRDESVTGGIDGVQFNTARSYIGRGLNAFLSITSGSAGWKNATLTAAYQDAGFVRVLDVAIAQLRPFIQAFLGQRPATNPDGTIEESVRRAWSVQIDTAFKQAVGLIAGGSFATPQASFAIANISPSSQLGQSPKQLIVNYTLVSLGEVTSIQNNMAFSPTLAAAA